MSAPIFRDPVTDGATDPVVVRDRASGQWRMFYTQRRPHEGGPGVEWVHGSRIGIAVSADGIDWQYAGVVEGLDDGGNTHWAPEVIDDGERYRMFLTCIAGVPDGWHGHPRRIVQFVSDDLENWTRLGEVPLASDRVIDAAVARTRDGRLRLWFKDEAADSTTGVAGSDDYEHWDVEGTAVGGDPHEGPNVFELGGWFWMIVDAWRGQRVLRSDDGLTWVEHPTILNVPGVHPDDRQVGRHADVVVTGADTAVVFYFTHPGWDGTDLAAAEGVDARVTAIHRAALTVVDGRLQCDRNVVPTPL